MTLVATAPSIATRDIFAAFLRIGLTSVGGGASAHIHEAVVTKHKWLDEKRFVEAMTVARSLPGTNVSNLAAFVGMTLGGTRGAVAAVAGVVVPGALIVLATAIGYVHLAPHTRVMRGILHGLGVGATAVMVVLAIQAIRSGARASGGPVLMGAAAVAVGLLHVNVLWALVALVPVAAVLARNEK